MSNQAFQISGLSVLIAASSSTGLAPTQVSTGNQGGMFVSNPSTVSVYVAYGSSTIAAAVPTTAAPARGDCIPAGRCRPYATPSIWLSAVTSAGAANVFATPGYGGA